VVGWKKEIEKSQGSEDKASTRAGSFHSATKSVERRKHGLRISCMYALNPCKKRKKGGGLVDTVGAIGGGRKLIT